MKIEVIRKGQNTNDVVVQAEQKNSKKVVKRAGKRSLGIIESKIDKVLEVVQREGIYEAQIYDPIIGESKLGHYSEREKLTFDLMRHVQGCQLSVTLNPVKKGIAPAANNCLVENGIASCAVEAIEHIHYLPIEIWWNNMDGSVVISEQKKAMLAFAENMRLELLNQGLPASYLLEMVDRLVILIPVGLENSIDNVKLLEETLVIISETHSTKNIMIDKTTFHPSYAVKVNDHENKKSISGFIEITEVLKKPDLVQPATKKQIQAYIMEHRSQKGQEKQAIEVPAFGIESSAAYQHKYFNNPQLVNSNIKISTMNVVTGVFANKYIPINYDFRDTVDQTKNWVDTNQMCNIYIAPVTYKSQEGTKDQINYVTALHADFDSYGSRPLKDMDPNEAEDCRKKMIEALKSQDLKPSQIIISGNGLHCYWILIEPLSVDDQIKQIEGGLRALASLPTDFKGDPAAAVLGHTLRLPGTMNFKDPENVKECKIIWEDESAVYDYEALICDLNVPEMVEQSDERQYSGSLLEAYKKFDPDYDQLRYAGLECDFLKWMARNPDKQTRILWYHLCNNLAHFGEHGRELFHIISKKYPGYSYEETERLFQTTLEKAKNQGFLPTSCSRIAEDGFVCPNDCAQKTPAGMMYSLVKSTIAAEEEKDKNPNTIDDLIKNLIPNQYTIENVKTLEAFITDVINPRPDSLLVKEYYLGKARDKLNLRSAGSIAPFKRLLVNTTFGNTGNIQVDISEALLKEVLLKYICGDIYKYTEGVWTKYSEYMDGLIINRLGKAYSKKHVEGIIKYIRGVTYLPAKEINQHTKENLLCVKNGMVKIGVEGCGELLPHDPRYNALSKLDIEYDPEARCPKYLKFLDQCFVAMLDKDREMTKQALQDWFGYSLLPGNQFHRFALLIGESRAGKGVILRLYTALLGQDNVSSIPFPILNQPINTVQLINKLANVAPELNEYDRFDEAFMKTSTSEDLISGRGHYENAVSFQNPAKYFGSSNHLPKIFEKGDALELRLMTFPFLSQVPEEKRNIHLFDELLAELPGILNWAIEGRQRLMERGRFLESQPMLDMKTRIKENSNLIIQWFNEIKDGLNKDNKYETFKTLYAHFKDFCDEEGVKKVPLRKTFRENLKCIPGVRIEQLSKPNQECVFFDWEKLGIEVAKLEPVDGKSASSFDLTDEFVFLEDSENAASDQTGHPEIPDQVTSTTQSAIDTQVIELLENKHSDTRAFN